MGKHVLLCIVATGHWPSSVPWKTDIFEPPTQRCCSPTGHTPAATPLPAALQRSIEECRLNNLDLSPLHIPNNATSDREFHPYLLCLVSSDKGHRPVRQTRSSASRNCVILLGLTLVYREPGSLPELPVVERRTLAGI